MGIFKKNVVRFLRSFVPGKNNDRNIVAETLRDQMVMNLVILSPEIDEQGSGHPENLVSMSPKLDEQGTRQPDNPVLMPPEIDEQVSRQSENPEEKKSADSNKNKHRFYLKLFFRCLKNIIKTRREKSKLFYEVYYI